MMKRSRRINILASSLIGLNNSEMCSTLSTKGPQGMKFYLPTIKNHSLPSLSYFCTTLFVIPGITSQWNVVHQNPFSGSASGENPISNTSFCSLGNWDLERLNNLFNITPVLDVDSALQTQEFPRSGTHTCLSDTWLLKYKHLYTLDNLLLTKMQLTFKGLNFWLNTKRPYSWSDLCISYQLISFLAPQTFFIYCCTFLCFCSSTASNTCWVWALILPCSQTKNYLVAFSCGRRLDS